MRGGGFDGGLGLRFDYVDDEDGRGRLRETEDQRPEDRHQHHQGDREPETDQCGATLSDEATLIGKAPLKFIEIRIEEFPADRARGQVPLQDWPAD